jgi:threonine dehydrogenase-like Zn-dependent dehydrogenase
VADFVGYADVIPEGLRMLRGGGCYLEVGSISPGNVFSYDATALVRANTHLVATSNYSPWALEQSLSFMKRSLERFPFERVISHVFPLERISEAFAQADWAQRGGDPAGVSRAAISM